MMHWFSLFCAVVMVWMGVSSFRASTVGWGFWQGYLRRFRNNAQIKEGV